MRAGVALRLIVVPACSVHYKYLILSSKISHLQRQTIFFLNGPKTFFTWAPVYNFENILLTKKRGQFPSLKLTNFKIKDFVKRLVYIGVVGLAESKSGHNYELSLLHFTVILAFTVKILKTRGKIVSQIFDFLC